jgi:hypothetical protein
MEQTGLEREMTGISVTDRVGIGASIVWKVLLWVLIPLALAAVVLDFGVWTREHVLEGPFNVEGSPGTHAVVLRVPDVPLSCCLEVRSDNAERLVQSDLQLWINGQEMGPPHELHDTIRKGSTTAYSHWGDYVIFALPDGVENAATTTAVLRYSVRPTRLTVWLLVGAAASLWLLFYWNAARAFVERAGKIGAAAILALYRFGGRAFVAQIGMKALLWLLIPLALAVVVLDFGVWTREQVLEGPFNVEGSPGTHAVVLRVPDVPLSCCLEVRSDNAERLVQSDLQLWINGQEMGPPHELHDTIRKGSTTAYSHWGGDVIFALPDGIGNAATTTAVLRYSVRPTRVTVWFLVGAAASLWLLLYWNVARASVERGGNIGVAILAFYRFAVRAFVAQIGMKALLWVLIPLAFAAVVLDQGVWTREEAVQGPFAGEDSPGSHAFYIRVRDDVPLPCCMEVRSDNADWPFQSDLRLWLNGEEMGPPHAEHDAVRTGNTRAYSHWGDDVIFALPDGVVNAATTTAVLRYSVRPTRVTVWLLVGAAASLWLLLYWNAARAFVERGGGNIAVAAILAPYRFAHVLGYAALLACVVYLGATAFAFVSGWALPTTALIHWSAAAKWLAAHEPWLGFVLVAHAAIGAVVTWLSSLLPGRSKLVDREETRLRGFFGRWGILISAVIFVFSISAMWSGMVRPGDQADMTIGGLLPFSDGAGDLFEAYDQARDGTWGSFTLRKPLAGAFRSVLLFFGGYSLPGMLIVQIVVLSSALCIACFAVARWRGFWPALAFFGLSYTYVRSFAPTTWTEPLGLTWAFLSIPFLIGTLRTGSRSQALFGLGATTIALMTRLGAMFTIPALMAWMVLRRSEQQKIKAGILAVAVVIGVLSLNSLLPRLYGTGGDNTASHFSYVACGLAIGTTWDGCPRKIQQEGGRLPSDEKSRAAALYHMAWENFETHVFLNRLLDATAEFVRWLPALTWRGYRFAVVEPDWFPRGWVSVLCLIGISAVLYRRREPDELTFWISILTGILLSVPIVFMDDGSRILETSYVLWFLLIALAFTAPGQRKSNPRHEVLFRPRTAGYAAAVAILLLAGIPGLSHLVYAKTEPYVDGSVARRGDHVVSGQRVSGFLVVADGAPLRTDVPTVHSSDFAKMLGDIETVYQGVIHPRSPPLPFGFVFSPSVIPGDNGTFQYIVPPAVLERHDVSAWRFTVENWQPISPGGPYWFRVTNAVPLK